MSSAEKPAMPHFKACFLVLGLLPLAACITAARPDDGQNVGSSTKGFPLDNFEGAVAANNVGWWASADQNNLGSTAEFKAEPGVEGGNGSVGHFTGHLGRSAGKTYSWASLGLQAKADGSAADFSSVKMIRFRVKGDGGKYRLDLPRDAVKDYGNFASTFMAPAAWTTVEIRLDSLRQPDWAVQLPRVWNDVKTLELAPLDEGKDFNLYVDDVELVLAPNKPNPFEEPDAPPAKIDGTAIVLDDFDGKGPINGSVWGAEMDTNNLGTIATYRAEDSGDATHKTAGHLSGKLGKNIKPWPWASLAINIDPNATPTDLTMVKGIRFWAKGSGAYRAAITRKAVTDYGNFAYGFGGPKDWKQIVVPLDKMKQADWAQKVPAGFNDAISFEIQPVTGDAPFDLWVDDVEFVVEPGKPSPFKSAK
jgi:Carbohydrate binding domain (family 11)